MLRFLVRRSLGALVIIWLISAVTFFLFFALPSEPAQLACGKNCGPEALEIINKNLGLDEPVPVQYWHYLVGIFAGRDFDIGHCSAPCLGYSFRDNQPVWETLLDRYPTTLSLAFGGTVVFLVVGITIGMVAAARRGTFADKFLSSLSLIGNSLQIYFVGTIALWLLVDTWDLVDRPEYVPISENPAKWAGGMLLPWLVMSIIFIANYSRMTRSQMIEQLGEDHVRTARAKGMSSRTVFFRYAWRGAMAPIVTIVGIDLGSLFGGAMVTEFTFTLHGLGRLAVDSVTEKDLPMLMGVMLFSCTAIVIANIIVDALYAAIDPRVRLA
ncbi:ABC transporter permease [Streptomyces sp. XD-27]|uniref:ABC transporter permease n=1 Tax=Streptomyces sp. XD-27 TaxID=3062779 RepID=UPI0026F413DB|nr:ABC transporter permease [Streptomyces sp. XD-27]WKX72408.1 ABC transporter permease [Streptomyces sp. XD-27]